MNNTTKNKPRQAEHSDALEPLTEEFRRFKRMSKKQQQEYLERIEREIIYYQELEEIRYIQQLWD